MILKKTDIQMISGCTPFSGAGLTEAGSRGRKTVYRFEVRTADALTVQKNQSYMF